MRGSCPFCEAKDAVIDRLEARVAELQGTLETGVRPPLEWALTQQEGRVIGVLLTRELATKQAILLALYGDRPEADMADPKIVDVFICKARKKLAPFGVVIETVRARGYRIAPECRAELLTRLSQARAA